MAELPAALLTACVLILCANVYYAMWLSVRPTMRAMRFEPRRIVKYIRVYWEQAQKDERGGVALFVCVVVMLVWWWGVIG